MSAIALLTELWDRGVDLYLDGDRLRYRAPRGVVTPELLARIGERREELVVLVRRRAAILAEPPPLVARPRTPDAVFPLSFSQERLWFIDQLEPGNPAYNVAAGVRFRGALDVPVLERCLNAIVERHEALRTVFAPADEGAAQRIVPHADSPLRVLDLSAYPAEARAVEEQRVSTAEAQHRFDLGEGPLFRPMLLRLAPDEHVLLCTMHHIVTDLMSVRVFMRELAALYGAFSRGESSPLAPLQLQYPDYAAWQREWLQGAVLGNQLDYWTRQLRGAAPVLELPTDHLRPAVMAYRGARHLFDLPKEVSAAVAALAQELDATPFMVYLAAFKALLYRYSSQEDVVVGSPIAGRDRTEVEGLIGFFLNTLALRTRLGGDPTFRELLARVRDVTLGAYAHQEIPFEKIVEELQPERDLSHTPVFQVMFVFQGFQRTGAEIAGLSMEPVRVESGTTMFDLTLSLTQHGDHEVDGFFRYNTDLFQPRTLARMVGDLTALLRGAVEDPSRRLSALPLLPEEELEKFYGRGRSAAPSGPFTPFPDEEIEQSIPERFGRVAAAHPDRVAVQTRRFRWTFRELDRIADRIAGAILRARGEAPADGAASPAQERTALLFEHDAPMIAGLLGALRAGDTYVPLDPLYPQERIRAILDDAAARVLLTTGVHLELARELAAGTGLQVVDVDTLGDGPAERVSVPRAPASTACLLYSSGSTGRPKGTIQTHRHILHVVSGYTNRLRLSAADRLTLFSSYSHVAAQTDIYSALLNGATLLPFDVKSEGVAPLAAWVRDEAVTIYHSIPTLYRHFVDALAPGARFPEVRAVVLGGEEVFEKDVELFRRWFEPGSVFVNMYGSTETTSTLMFLVGHEDGPVRSPVPVGYPVGENEVFLLNDAGGRSQVYGEIAVRSPYIVEGYWRAPAEANARFLPDPEGGERRIYRTGDFGRRLADGSVVLLGRKDFQVKIRGFRVELGEIESALGELPGVKTAVAAALEVGADRRLVAYVVPERPEDPPSQAELRNHVRERLPSYMVPAAFVVLDAVPLTPGGKVNRLALPAPDWEGLELGGGYVAPRTEVEREVADIWSELLKVERIGVHDSFFDLGGHSLLATRLIAHLRRALSVDLPLRRLFEEPTVAGVASQVELSRAAADGAGAPGEAAVRAAYGPPIVPVPRDGSPLPLSFAQQRMWLAHEVAPESAAYNMFYALRLSGPLDADALRRALDETVRRHEALRTRFPLVDGAPAQLVDAPAPVQLEFADLSAMEPAERDARVRELGREEARRPFDLARGPLLRARLLRLAPEESALLFALHHIVSDGWSTGVLVREVSGLYAAFTRGEASPLPELEVQYADYAAWQREWLSGAELERQVDYWKGRLAGAPPLLDVPTDCPRGGTADARGALAVVELPAGVTAGLRELARRERATPYMALLAAWQALLGRYAGADDVVVGTPTANRTRPEVQGLIGFFVNTLAMRADLSGDPSFRALLARTREAVLGAYAHQDLPFERVLDELGVERGAGHAPLAQAFFELRAGGADAVSSLGAVRAEPLAVQAGTIRYDLELTVLESGGALRLSLGYRPALFDEATARTMVERLAVLLREAVAAPDRALSDLPLAEAAELDRTEGRTGAPLPVPAAGVHQLFAERAAATPQAVAVEQGAERLTYAALDRRVALLAGHLRGLGAGPETRVAVCLESSIDRVVALLAVLRAGAVFVPLDPDHPTDRQALVLADSGARLMVTRAALLESAGDAPAAQVEVVCVDRDAARIEAAPAADPAAVSPHGLAYVIYTSGSTGRPKGVLVEHGSLAGLMASTAAEFGFAAGDVVLPVASFAFDIWLFEVLAPLLAGATLRVVTRVEVVEVEPLVDALRGATAFHAVPALMRQVVDTALQGGGPLPGMRRVFVGGDAVPPELLAGMRAAFPAAKVRILYGPTETTVLVSSLRLAAEPQPGRHRIGGAIPNAALYVCDPQGRRVPAGIPGELYIGGPGVARGYHGRPDLTAERFVPDPFGGEPGARLYRSGDRVRRLADGTLEFLGRADAQVKIRGFRIEPGEVEAALRALPQVHDAVVVVREDAPGERRLVGYVVAAPPAAEQRPVELWPSIGEYFVYDELIYSALAGDELRNGKYLRALERVARGRVVLDVGTGGKAILARLAVRAGARKVYAVELLEASFLAARQLVRELGLEDRITVLHGDARTVELPEPADVCVSEIVESIAGAEGAAVVLNEARRLLRPGAAMVPAWSHTRIAAATLPEEIRGDPRFAPTPAHYVRRIFEQVGHPFDVRLCIRNFPAGNLLSTPGVFEALDFAAGPVAPEYRRRETLRVERDGRMDGFLLWLRMELAEGEVMDVLEEETAWFPVWFPALDAGVEVRAGDVVEVECSASLSDNGVAPDYAVRGVVRRAGAAAVEFEHVSAHHAPGYGRSALHRQLLDGSGEPAAAPGADGAELPALLRTQLRRSLPDYMVPSAVVVLDALPLTPNGKVDRRALPAPEAGEERYLAPRTPTEEALAAIWAETLGLERVGAEGDFFLLGGHSLLATRAMVRVRETFGVEVALRTLLEQPTVAAMARVVEDVLLANLGHGDLARELELLAGIPDDELERLLDGG